MGKEEEKELENEKKKVKEAQDEQKGNDRSGG